MKKLLLIILVLFGLGVTANAQNLVSEEDLAKMNLSGKDSLMFSYMDTYETQLSKPRYQLFSTKNMWTFLKLDTATGRIWQVQFSTEGDEYRFETPLNSDYLVSILQEGIVPGRFTLYQTENIYNLLLLDQKTGRCWQVQWKSKSTKPMIINIY